MARTGLTNFVAWSLATFFPAFVLLPQPGMLLAVGAAALVVAWSTRFWPEGLGVSAGVLGLLLVRGTADGASLIGAAAIGAGMVVVWRWRAGATGASPAALPNGTSTPKRLVAATLLASLAVLLANGFLLLAFGFTCQSDTSHATPGSDRAAWC